MSDIVEALVNASRGWSGGTPNGAMLRATRAFLAAAEQDAALLGEAATALGGRDPGAAAWIAVACGTVVESGAPAALSGPGVFDLLRAWLPKLPESREAPSPEPTAEQTALLPLFQYLCQSVVTHLARLPEPRAAMGQDLPLLDRLGFLQGYSFGAVWVREALLKSSGSLVLLHPPGRAGLRLSYTHVSNCFHLFSLLQSAVGTALPGGRAPQGVSTEAWWHYGSPLSPVADLGASIWGEGLVRDLPRIEGVAVILAWPPLMQSRSWDAAFLGPHLDAMPASVVVDSPLPAADVDAWLARLGVTAPAGPRPWWRFW